MATLIAIILVFGMIAFFVLLYITDSFDQKSSEGLFTLVLIPTVIIALGIHYDLNGSLPTKTSEYFDFSLIGSLVFLAVTTFLTLIIALFRGVDFSRFNSPGANFTGFLLTTIGFISSLLGIASFYLDYLR